MDVTLTDTFELNVPHDEVALMKKLMRKMGWEVKKIKQKKSMDAVKESLRDYEEGRYTVFDNTDDLFKHLGI